MSWKRKGITRKFVLIFILLLSLVLLRSITGYISYQYINTFRDTIQTSNRIAQLVMEMDRGLELARRLHGNFFMYFETIGLQEAHEQYAQPSVREIAKVVSLSRELKKLLFESERYSIKDIREADVNLYLAFARRFADTSIEAVELLTRRAAPETGVESQIQKTLANMQTLLQDDGLEQRLFLEARSHLKEYLLHRQRFQIQSSINVLDRIAVHSRQNASAVDENDVQLFDSIATLQQLAMALADIDLAISGKFRDFQLQADAISPISEKLIRHTQRDSAAANKGIERAMEVTRLTMAATTILTVLILLYIAWLVHTGITRNVIELTRTAVAHSEGRLDVRARVTESGEIGQLATVYNDMAGKLSDLVNNLEEKVARRTAELSLSEERFRSLVNDLPKIAVQGFDTRGIVNYWNKASERLYGYPELEALGKNFIELIYPDRQKDGVRQQIESWLHNGVAIPAAESTLINRSGHDVNVFISYAMQVNSLGEKRLYCMGIDLAELKQAQELAEVNVSFYRQLFDHSSSGVVVYKTSDQGRTFVILDLNHASERIERVSREEVLNRSATDIFPGIEEMGLLATFREVWKTGRPAYSKPTLYTDSRISGWRENRVYKLPSGEIVAVYEDVTARMNIEAEKQAMEMRLQRAQKMETIGVMAGGIAHDLNNILSAIVGYPELLLSQLGPEDKLRKPLGSIKSAGERAAAIVDDLLTVARGVASAKTAAQLNTQVEEYFESPEFYKLREDYPAVRFESDLANDLPAILCSPIHVKKCLMNLASNGAESIKSTGYITISTQSSTRDEEWYTSHDLENKRYVVLSIADTGTGIHEKDLDHIFEPFYSKKVMGKRSGTGLGLSVVWHTMKEHGGAVLVSSDDRGTRFELYFPVADELTENPETVADNRDLQGNGERILVVDDEPQQRDLATKMLEHFGYSVTTRSSGEEAVSYLLNNHADVILLDMVMDPGMNGREAYRLIKENKPGQKAIIASGFSESIDVKDTLEMGAGQYIKKPYAMLELARAVQQELQN